MSPEAPLAEIKPNITKAFIRNLMIVGFIVILIISLLIYLDYIVGLEVFSEAFKTFQEFGVQLSPSRILAYSIFLVLFFTSISLILNYVTLSKSSYIIYPDKIVYSKNFFIMQIGHNEIPYSNITKISYQKKPFLDTSKIILGLTGMKKNKIELDFIDDAAEIVKQLQNLVKEHRAKYYAKYSQEYNYQHIMDKH